MRQLVLLRGAQGSGKSTWIKNNGLEDYSLSPDRIRLMLRAPVTNTSGSLSIDQSVNEETWNLVFNLLENRMKKGDFTIIDSCNSKTLEMSRYKDLAKKYRYRIFLVDFTDVPKEVAIERNLSRSPDYKIVPTEVIINYYSRFKTQKVPGGITIIKPEEFNNIFLKLIDFSNYRNVYVIGDVHGCHTALTQFFDSIGGISDEDFYIFVGDLLDRGIENDKMMSWVIENYTRKNILFLEGNHEAHWINWANDNSSKSKEFEIKTKHQLENAGIDKKACRLVHFKIGQCAYFKYLDKVFLVNHAGVPFYHHLISSSELINGVGKYSDVDKISESWSRLMPDNCYQIFGHRNIPEYKIDELADKYRCYILEGKVEFGGDLRVVKITKNEFGKTTVSPIYIKNTVFAEVFKTPTQVEIDNLTVKEYYERARKTKSIIVKNFGNISSINFSSQVFKKRDFDDFTIKARGLFIDTEENKVVLRSYNKFFNINEHPETEISSLTSKMTLPINVYLKYNGFLGLVSVYKGEFIFASKSVLEGEHVNYLRDIFNSKISEEGKNKLLKYLESENSTAVFEVIDVKNDPHIIEYKNNDIILLDIIKNDLVYSKKSYSTLQNVACRSNISCKKLCYTIKSMNEFTELVDKIKSYDYIFEEVPIEGYVFEDSKGFMTKLKSGYYYTWKTLRDVILRDAFNQGYSLRTGSLSSPIMNQFYQWLINKISQYKTKEERLSNIENIIELRKKFEQETLK